MELRARWNARHRARAGAPRPCALLTGQAGLLPAAGRALDLACGRGGNALWLARRGWTVDAWDLADAAVEELRTRAAREALDLRAEVRDVTARPPPPDCCDLAVVSHFLHRPLLPALAAAVRPGGVLAYQTFLAGHPGPGPRNPDYLLRPGELRERFPDWEALHDAERNGQAQFLARRPG